MLRVLPLAAAGLLLLAAALLSRAPSLAPRAAVALTGCDTTTAPLDAAESRMLQLVNEARSAQGLVPLVPSAALNRAAAWKSEDAPKTGLSHIDSLGRDPFRRMLDCGYANSGLGENVGLGSSSADAIFNAFMQSPGHRAAILLAEARAIGIGYAAGHWTLNFGRIVDGDATPPASPTPSPSPTRTPTPVPSPTMPPGVQILAIAPMLSSE